jgi:acyl-CoA thioester hydrolase
LIFFTSHFAFSFFMDTYSKTFELRWGDVDANMHVMHSKYYELGAHCRMSFLFEHGITAELLKKELNAGEMVAVDFVLTKARKDGSRFSVKHEVKKTDGTVAAIMHADLAWMDLVKRKLMIPPAIVASMIEHAPKGEGFVME